MDTITYLTKIKSKFERHHCEKSSDLLLVITMIVNNFSNCVISGKSKIQIKEPV